MKKVLLFIAAALTLSSCVKEQLGGAESDKVQVSFGLSLDGGVQTRAEAATGHAEGVDELWYAVFDENDVLIEQFAALEPMEADFSKKVEVPLTLTKGQTYTVAFWAQNSECEAYEVSEDMKVTVTYEDYANNDTKRDAFYGKTEKFTVGAAFDKTVTLTRPFAQINAGVTTDDFAAAVKTNFVVAQSSATISGVPTILDVFTGKVDGNADVSYVLADIPNAYDPAAELAPALNVAGTNYMWLSMSYILADVSSTHDVTFTFKAADGSKAPVVIADGLANVPVKRNWRTNIAGTLLTGNVQFEIQLDNTFTEPGYDITDKDINGGEMTDDEFYARLQKGGAVYVNEEIEEINFNNLTIAQETFVILNKTVREIKLGGNKAVDVKAASTMPNITIFIPKDVEYPTFSFNANTENYTIKGDLNTSAPLTSVIQTTGNVKNFTVENVKATGNAMIDTNNGTTGLTVKNCVATDLNAAFVDLFETRDAKILNNTIALAASAQPAGDARHAITVWNCGDDILIEGNTITKTYKHGIFAQGVGTSALTIKDNKISGVVEDGIKIDRSHKVVVTGNVIDAADYGIRVDRLLPTLGTADITITDNTISIDGIDVDGADATAIRVRHRNEGEFAGEVTVNLTAKGNKEGTNGIPAGKYADFTSEGMTLTGDYENPFDGCLKAGGRYYTSLSDAIAAGDTDILLPAGEWTLNKGGNNLKITGVSTDAKVILAGGDLRWKTAILENVTIISPATGDDPQGGVISVEGTTVHNNCVIENVYFCLGTSTEFNGCTFNMTNPNTYNVWTYGSNASFNDCEFYSAGKAALVYAHGNGGDKSFRKTNFKDCKFYASAPAAKKAAIEIDSSLCPFDLNIENCTSEGFDLGSVSKNSLYNLKNGTLGVNCIITVDGLQYLSDGFVYDVENKVYNYRAQNEVYR